MITLPSNWKSGIRVRPYAAPPNQYGEVGFLVLVLKNSNSQVWEYTQSVILPGGSANDTRKKLMKKEYREFVQRIPNIAASQSQVVSYVNGNRECEDITNDEWELVEDVNLVPYNKYIKEINNA